MFICVCSYSVQCPSQIITQPQSKRLAPDLAEATPTQGLLRARCLLSALWTAVGRLADCVSHSLCTQWHISPWGSYCFQASGKQAAIPHLSTSHAMRGLICHMQSGVQGQQDPP